MSWLSSLFKPNQKRDTSYTGSKPYSSLTQAEGGGDYLAELKRRMVGQGVGYGDNYASQYSNPIVQNMRNQFESYQLPELKSELSASGRRKGSAGFDQLSRAYANQGYQEGDVYSRLAMQNEAQKRNEINAALEGLGAFAQNDYNARNNYSNFDYALNRAQVGDATAQRAEGAAAGMRGIGTAIGLMSGIPSSQSSASMLGFNQLQPAPAGGSYYMPSAPPIGYDYSNMISARRPAKIGQVGRQY